MIKPHPYWLLAALPLFLLAADSGPQRHELTLNIPSLTNIFRPQFVNRAEDHDYQIVRGDEQPTLLLLDRKTGRVWELMKEPEKEGFVWVSMRFLSNTDYPTPRQADALREFTQTNIEYRNLQLLLSKTNSAATNP